MAFRPETDVAIGAVTRGLAQARAGMGGSELAFKGTRDVVTPTDVAVEDTIRSVVGDALGLPVVGEERGGEVPDDGSPYWIVDPICGTRNFASGIPLYCVNLALVEQERVSAAVVGDPSTGEIHVAEAGRGAWALNDGDSRRLTAGVDSETIIVEESHSEGARRDRAARFTAAAIRANRWDLRNLGTTLSVPYLAAGRVAAYVVFWAPVVHLAAGSLLAAEAGATVSDLDGARWTLLSDAIVAGATPELHRELLELLRV